MATNNPTPNPNPPAVPEDPNHQTPQQIRDRAAGQPPAPQPPPAQPPSAPAPGAPPPAQQPPAAPQPPAQQPPRQAGAVPRPQQQQDGSFVITLPTGQRYVGRTAEDAYDNLATAQITASGTIRDLREQAQRYQRGVQVLSGDPNAQLDSSGQAKPVFEANIYRSLQEQDPITAELYLLQHIFGLNSIEEVQPIIQDMRFQTVDYANNMAINQFRAAAPDFPANEAAVDKLMDTMQQAGLAFNARNLIMVHNSLKQQNAYPAPQGQPVAQPGAPQYPPQAAYPTPPQQAYNPAPQGPYAFEPGRGFTPFNPTAPAPQFAPPQNPYAPAPPPGYAPQPPNYAAPPPVYAAPPFPGVPGYPGIPQPAQVPIPGGPAAAPGTIFQPAGATEDAIYGMDRTTLREQINNNLLR